jgi:hypothetical protein
MQPEYGSGLFEETWQLRSKIQHPEERQRSVQYTLESFGILEVEKLEWGSSLYLGCQSSNTVEQWLILDKHELEVLLV